MFDILLSMKYSSLADHIEAVIGYGQVAKIKMSIDRITGKPTGYAFVNFFTPAQV
jgi:RNA recognition motif-containing protein